MAHLKSESIPFLLLPINIIYQTLRPEWANINMDDLNVDNLEASADQLGRRELEPVLQNQTPDRNKLTKQITKWNVQKCFWQILN